MGVSSIAPLRRAVFLDRDGVLNRAVVRDGKPFPPADLADLQVLPGVREALSQLREHGFLLYVVTNQPDVARGTRKRSSVEAIHESLRDALPLDGFYVCFHDDADRCGCRKPKPGLLLTAAEEHGISLPASFMVGDRWRDVEAGQHAGCRTAWVDCGYAERGPVAPADATVRSFPEAAAWILQESRKDRV